MQLSQKNIGCVQIPEKSTYLPRIKSFGRFLESGRFPKGGALWSPSAEGEIPQPPDLMYKTGIKAQTIDGRQEF